VFLGSGLSSDLYLDAGGEGCGFWYWLALFEKFFDVDFDAVADENSNFLLCFGADAEARKVRSVGTPTTVLASFEDDQIISHLYIQTCLLKNTLYGAFGKVFCAVICNDHCAGLGRVLVNVVTAL